jgi:cytochrome b subunit of formate dehydrogenase
MNCKKIVLLCIVACLLLLPLWCSLSFARDPENCLFCHKYRRLRGYDEKGVLHNYYVDAKLHNESIHRDVACVDCHTDIDQVPHKAEAKKVDCSKECHIDKWKIMSGGPFSHRDVAENYRSSIHGVKPDDKPEVAQLKPDCKYCHLDDVYELSEEVPSDAVLKRCMNCHKEQGLKDIFIHIYHRFKRKHVRKPLEIVELCSSCHADKDFQNVMGFTGARAEVVETYKETIHYRILQLGGQDTADCTNCHAGGTIHNILPASDPKSSIHPENRYRTCQADGCHPGASPKISDIDSHLSKDKDKGIEITIIESAMQGVMWFTLFFLFTLMGMETYGRLRNHDARFFRWLRVPQKFTGKLPAGKHHIDEIPNLHRYVDFNPKGDYPRYSINIVINHFLVGITFTVAVATGLPLYFHNSAISHEVINLVGGINVTRVIHRFNAALFTFNCLYHLIVLLCGTLKRMSSRTFDIRRTQFPLWKDAKDLYFDIRYFLGLEKARPHMEKFMYKQKVHYLAMIWGCSVLTLSGVCLLFPESMVNYLPFPKVSFNLLRLLHADESVLAFLVITLWHLYNVHIAPGRFPMQWAFWNGRITRDHQIEEHFLEYERQVKEGVAECEEDKLAKGGQGNEQ